MAIDSVSDAFGQLWVEVVSFLPELLAALVIIIVGIVVAPIFGSLVRRLVDLLQVDTLAEKVGLHDTFRSMNLKFTFAGLIGKVVKWFIFIAFLIAASDVLGWTRVTEFLNEVVLYIPNVAIAIIILAAGLIAGSFVSGAVTKALQASNVPINHPDKLGKVAKWALVVFASLAALLQLGVAESLIQILFAGVVLALALAFGLGGKEKASRLLDSLDGTRR